MLSTMLLAVGMLLFIDSRLFITKCIISLNTIENSIQATQIVCPLPGKLQPSVAWTEHNILISFTTTNR